MPETHPFERMSPNGKKNRPSKKNTPLHSKAAGSQPGLSAGLDDRRTTLGLCVFLAVITLMVFVRTVHHEFVNYDDDRYVYGNPHVIQGLSWKGIAWAFTHCVNGNWHPLTVMSDMLDCRLYGLNAGGHHLTSVLLHTTAVILLFLVMREMTGATWRSALVATVFAIHPLRVESVAWVAERKDVLSGVFFMLTLWAYARYARHPFSVVRYLWVAGLFTLGLMSKPMLVTLPFVLLLLDYWPLNRFGGRDYPVNHFWVPRRLILEKIPLLALSGAACMATMVAQREIIMTVPLALRIGNAVVSYAVYLKQMFYPAGLAVFYPYPFKGLPFGEIALAILVLAAISAAAFLGRQKRPYVLVGWLWYLGMLVPVIGLVQVGGQARADRYTYLPQIGLYFALTWVVAELSVGWRHRRVVLTGLTAIIIAGLSFSAWLQTSYWRNSESLWTRTLAVTTDNYIAHNDLGEVFAQAGRLDEAIAHFQEAVEIKPDHASAHNNLGHALVREGKLNEAMGHFQTALEIQPNFADAYYNLGVALMQEGRVDEAMAHYQKAMEIQPDLVEAHNNLGNALIRKGRVDEAIAQYQKALEIQPGYVEAYNNLGNVLLQKGQVDEAAAQYQKALAIQPNYVIARNSLGLAFLQKGRAAEAVDCFQQALVIQPNYMNAQNNLAWVLATSPEASVRNGARAVDLAQQADRSCNGTNPVVAKTLAAAYAEAGRFSEAMDAARRAQQLAVSQSNPDLVNALQVQMGLYQAGSPFRDAGQANTPAPPGSP